MREGTDRRTAPGSFEEHEQYAAAMKELAAGNGDAAVEELRRLVRLYPDDAQLRELLLRTELQAAVGTAGAVPEERRAAAPVLRNLLIMLLVMTVGLGAIAGLLAAYQRMVQPTIQERQEEETTTLLRREVERRLAAGDWDGAEERLNALAERVPGDPWIEEARQEIAQGRALYERYLAGVTAQEAGNRAEALAIFQAIEQDQSGFRDVQDRIARIQEQEALDATWAEAESRVQAQDWAGAIQLLEQVRERDDARRALAEQRLYEIYAMLGRQEIEQAGGDLDRLRQGAAYLRRALQLKPSDRALAQEKELAEDYVAGAEAEARQDWVSAVQRWEQVHRIQPDYGDGQLEEKLRELYPQAARQLIAEAEGKREMLQQAMTYLDRALATRPDDEGLLTERRLLGEYLAGAETFAQGYWDLTIARWGPLYRERPDYQNGVLKEELTRACAYSDDPDPTYCPP